MPTYYKPGSRKGNKHWIIRGSINGKQQEISIPEATSKRGAAAGFDAVKYELENSREVPIDERTFSDAVDWYESSDRRSTQQMRFVHKLEEHLGAVPLSLITPGIVRGLAKKMYSEAARSTWNRQVVTPASAVVNNAADDGWCSFIKVRRFKEDAVLKVHPSDGAALLLMANAEKPIQRLYIAALHYQGLRPSDAVKMQWDLIDLKKRKFQLIIPKPNKAKFIVMDDDFWLELVNMKQQFGKVFPWGNRSSVYGWLKPLQDKLKVRFGARMARHKFASDLVEAGASAFDLVNNGSWTNTRSVEPYVTLQEDRAREMLNRKNKGKIRGKVG